MIDKDTVEANLVNVSALGLGMMSLDRILTLLVLGTALIYNVLKIIHGIKTVKMAKAKSTNSSQKVSFGKRGQGKYKKSYGPKAEKPKKYRGQGR